MSRSQDERWAAAAADDAVLRDRQARPLFVLDPERLAIIADPEAVATVQSARALARQLADELVILVAIAHQGYAVARADEEARRHGESLARVARRFGIDTSTLFRWRESVFMLDNGRAKLATPRTDISQNPRPHAMGPEGALGDDATTSVA